jgi:hypothetical protein
VIAFVVTYVDTVQWWQLQYVEPGYTADGAIDPGCTLAEMASVLGGKGKGFLAHLVVRLK